MQTVYPDEKNVVLNENSAEGKKTMYKYKVGAINSQFSYTVVTIST